MTNRVGRLAVGALFAALGVSTFVPLQSVGAAAPNITVHPSFAVLHTGPQSDDAQSASGPPTWTFKYKYLGTKYRELFIGTKPNIRSATTVPVDLIPIKLRSGTTVMNPNSPIGGRKSAVQQTLASPIFNRSIKYEQEGINVGKTQYEDAFQRAALWKEVSTNPRYHVFFGTPKVEHAQSLTVPASKGGVFTAFGIPVIIADIHWFDTQVQGMITSLGIPSTRLPIFVIVDSYLSTNSTSTGCCIGGYHNYNGVQAYSEFTYFTESGAFAQDVSALSNELGGYIDDPLTNNTDVPAACGTQGNDEMLYEVGDPLENGANFGDFAYTVGRFTWHLQDLVTPIYFGAKASTSVNGFKTFQGQTIPEVCEFGG